MKICIVGLGAMGTILAERMRSAGIIVSRYDPFIPAFSDIAQACEGIDGVWIMAPAQAVDEVCARIAPYLTAKNFVIDGGNSYFKESMRRCAEHMQRGIPFLDCGVSGGVDGRDHGFCLMVGGDKNVFDRCKVLWEALASCDGYYYCGRSGTGHYIKMVHNGIEYALLQSYAEGFQILKEGFFAHDLPPLADIARLWNRSSIIRSWILELAGDVLENDQNCAGVSGYIGHNGTGEWTLQEARDHKINAPMIQEAIAIRAWSRTPEGGSYATQLVALLRNRFGNHPIKKSG